MRPFESTFQIYCASDPILDAWRGACKWANSPKMSKYAVKKAEYEEYGGEYIKECSISNRYYATPAEHKEKIQTKKEMGDTKEGDMGSGD